MSKGLIIGGTVIVLVITYLYFAARRLRNIPEVVKSDKIIDLTDKNFKHQIKSNITLVDFWASWCMPCKMMAPVLNDVADEVDEGVKVCKVNVENYQSLASQYAIKGIPTMLLFRDGKEINRFVGVKSKSFLLEQIRKAS